MSLLAAILFTILGVVAGAILGTRFFVWLSNRGWNLLLCHRCYARILKENGHWKHLLKNFAHTSCPECSKVLIFADGDPVGPRLHELVDSLDETQGLTILGSLTKDQLDLLTHTIRIVNENHDLWIRGRKT